MHASLSNEDRNLQLFTVRIWLSTGPNPTAQGIFGTFVILLNIQRFRDPLTHFFTVIFKGFGPEVKNY